jgi:hypothetical protein
MRRFLGFAVVLAWAGCALGQCQFSASCNMTISRSLTFEDNACLDSETRRYQFFAISLASQISISVTVQSGFFAPALQLISPSNVVVAADNNVAGTSAAHLNYTTTTAGVWFVKVRNIDVGQGGPYSLAINCHGSIDPPPPPPPYALFVEPSPLTLGRSAAGIFHVTSVTNGDFNSEVRVSVVNLPSGVIATPVSFVFAPPGFGRQDVAVQTDDTVASGRFSFNVVGVAATGVVATGSAQLVIDAPCTPVRIQTSPLDVTTRGGQTARLSIQAGGTAPFAYQWYHGFSPNPRAPIAGATSADYETPPLTESSLFWVRLSNACGSIDSGTVAVTVIPIGPRRRRVRH